MLVSADRNGRFCQQVQQEQSCLPAERRSWAVEIVDLTQEHCNILGDPELGVFLGDFAFCALYNGMPVAAGGIAEPYWSGRGHAWFAKKEDGFNRRWWPTVTAAVRDAADRGLSSGKFRRIEMTVNDNDEKAKKWAVRLGFHPEAKCAKLMQTGEDGWIYARTE